MAGRQEGVEDLIGDGNLMWDEQELCRKHLFVGFSLVVLFRFCCCE